MPPHLYFPLFGGGGGGPFPLPHVAEGCAGIAVRGFACAHARVGDPETPLLRTAQPPDPKILFGAIERRTNRAQIPFSFCSSPSPEGEGNGEIFTCRLELTLYICARSSPLSASVGTHSPVELRGNGELCKEPRIAGSRVRGEAEGERTDPSRGGGGGFLSHPTLRSPRPLRCWG